MNRRRVVIAGLLLATTMRSVRAQQKPRVYRLVVVSPSDLVADMSETGSKPRWRAFFLRLRELGYVEGQDLVVKRYSGEGRTEKFAALAAQAVRDESDAIYVIGDRLVREVKAATDKVPVVTIVGDPISQGIVASLARPGGMVTGITVTASLEIDGKRLELLREIVPSVSRVGYLCSRGLWEAPYAAALREAARSINISIVGEPLDAPFDEAEYRRVFAAMTSAGADALYVGGQPENSANGRLVVELAQEAQLPAMYSYPEFVDIGGLVAYGADLSDVWRHAVDQIDQILKGAKPGDIPFYQPTKFTLSINLKTAKALGITVPPTLLIAADEVIE
jgi:putative ABC transport system substrate-binding protein